MRGDVKHPVLIFAAFVTMSVCSTSQWQEMSENTARTNGNRRHQAVG